jgi:hypothetical protein
VNTRAHVFLETSIQIDRFMHRERGSVILYNLLDKQIHTSSYVFSEFRRTLLRDLRFIYCVVKDLWRVDGEQGDIHLGDLLGKLSQAPSVRSVRRYQRFFWIAEGLLKCFGTEQVSVLDILEWLEEHIDTFTEEFFLVEFYQPNRRVEKLQVHCSTNCDLAKADRSLEQMSCRREKAHCSLSEFLKSRRRQLLAVLSAMEGAPSSKRDNKAIRALRDVLSEGDFKKAKGQQNCWSLGDTIIALEAPESALIYTLDHHYDVICEALGKERYEEQALPEGSRSS